MLSQERQRSLVALSVEPRESPTPTVELLAMKPSINKREFQWIIDTIKIQQHQKNKYLYIGTKINAANAAWHFQTRQHHLDGELAVRVVDVVAQRAHLESKRVDLDADRRRIVDVDIERRRQRVIGDFAQRVERRRER